MIKHIVMWKLKDPADAPRVKAEIDSCRALVPGMLEFEVAIRTAGFEGNCEIVLYSAFENSAALAAYQTHPWHQQVSALVVALRETRNWLDYEI